MIPNAILSRNLVGIPCGCLRKNTAGVYNTKLTQSFMSTIFGSITVEGAEYNLLKKCNDFEVRKYKKCIYATTQIEGEGQSFRKLAGYIFGNGKEKIEMTAPVVTTNKSMSFVMPPRYTMETLPVPADSSEVILEHRPEVVLAVKTFGWYATSENVKEQSQMLMKSLDEQGIAYQTDRDPLVFQYNPPWCLPFLRTNEVAVELVDTDIRFNH